jgi:rod shape-determining protein MreD
MGRALVFFLACMALLRLEFALVADAAPLDPVFLSGLYAAFAVEPPGSVWLALLMGLAGDWMMGYPLGLQGLGLVIIVYLAFMARKHVLMSTFFHFLLLATGLYLLQGLLMVALNLLLHLKLLLAVRPLDVLTAVLTCLAGAVGTYRHEKRNRL